MKVSRDVVKAYKRIRNMIRKTPLEFSPYLSELCGCNVFLKLEFEQLTGSFKIRGALNKILSLSKEQIKRGVVAYSTGNHAMAVAYAAKLMKSKAVIFVPYNVGKSKLEMLKYFPVEIKTFGKSSEETEITRHAREFALNNKMAFVSPYNDPLIIAGQGTIGYELKEQLPSLDCVFVCVGGGGLISGIAGYLKSKNSKIKIIGCEPKASPAMSESIKKGKVANIKIYDTLSDGSSGNNEKDTITFGLCKRLVDKWIIVNETEIADSIRLILEKHHKLIEGAAAVPLAALIKEKQNLRGKNAVIVLCGANISAEKLKKILR